MDGLAIAAALNELRPAVEGGIVRTVYQPSRDLFILRASGRGSRRVLISPKDAAIHLTQLDIPNPRKPTNFAMLLRKHLRGGRIAGIRQRGWDRIVVFSVERKRGARSDVIELVAELAGLRGNLLLVRDGIVIGSGRRDSRNRPGRPYVPLSPQSKLDPRTIEAASVAAPLEGTDPVRALAGIVDGLGRETAADSIASARSDGSSELSAQRVCDALHDLARKVECPEASVDAAGARATFYPLPPPARRYETFSRALDMARELSDDRASGGERAVRVRLQRALRRRSRTAEKLREWLDAAGEAERLRHWADLLLTRQSEIEAGVASVSLTDPASEEMVEIRLDPSLGPIENAQRLYERSKRLRRGRPHVEERLRRIDREIVQIRRAIEAIDEGGPLPEEAARLLPPDRSGRPSEGAEPSSGRRFTIEGHVVLVGRDANENDRLLREAAPDDLWMHVRGASGSHVIVRRGGRAEIPEGVVREAARLAARYSKARGERRVDVVMTAVKHVRKPKGAPPGLVIVRNEDTLTVDPDPRERE